MLSLGIVITNLMLLQWRDDYKEPEDVRLKRFSENMDAVLLQTESRSLRGINLVLIPINQSDHFYMLSFNLVTYEMLIIDNNGVAVEYEGKYQGWLEKNGTFGRDYLKSAELYAFELFFTLH